MAAYSCFILKTLTNIDEENLRKSLNQLAEKTRKFGTPDTYIKHLYNCLKKENPENKSIFYDTVLDTQIFDKKKFPTFLSKS